MWMNPQLDACVSLSCPVQTGELVTFPFTADINGDYLSMMVRIQMQSTDGFFFKGLSLIVFGLFEIKVRGFFGNLIIESISVAAKIPW